MRGRTTSLCERQLQKRFWGAQERQKFGRGLGKGADGRRKETICCKDCRGQNMESEEEREGVDSDTEII